MKDSIRLLVVDDSKLMRKVIRNIFDTNGHIEVVGEAGNGKEALDIIPKLNPDVITLDINMPEMDGITTLKHIMIKHPKPTVMLSALTQEGAEVTFDALKFGAIDFVPKPSNQQDASLEEQSQNIIKKISMAAEVEIEAVRRLKAKPKSEKTVKPEEKECKYICALGASEGGYPALLKIIPQLNPDNPAAYLAVLYEDPVHVEAFAHYLDQNSAITVKRAKDGTSVEAGVCYIASGREYITVYAFYGEYSLQVNTSPFPSRRGAINMLMISLAERAEKNAIGVILSGSGDDGAEGVSEIIRLGGSAIVQEPKSCLHKDMPNYVIRNVQPLQILSDSKIAEEINNRCSG